MANVFESTDDRETEAPVDDEPFPEIPTDEDVAMNGGEELAHGEGENLIFDTGATLLREQNDAMFELGEEIDQRPFQGTNGNEQIGIQTSEKEGFFALGMIVDDRTGERPDQGYSTIYISESDEYT